MQSSQENAASDVDAWHDIDSEELPPAAQLRAVVLALDIAPPPPEGTRGGHRRIWFVLASVAVVQIAWLAWQGWPEGVPTPPLQVTLDSEPTPEPQREQAPAQEPEPEVAPQPELAPEPVPDVAEEDAYAEVPKARPEEETADVREPVSAPERPHARVMIENARAWLQTKELPERASPVRSFSSADLALAASEGDDDGERWRRPQAIRQYARVPQVIRYKDKRGYTTIRKIDAWGNVTCVQERGFKGDANPPLWYSVPYC